MSDASKDAFKYGCDELHDQIGIKNVDQLVTTLRKMIQISTKDGVMIDNTQIFIPPVNSEAWLGLFIRTYRESQIKISPDFAFIELKFEIVQGNLQNLHRWMRMGHTISISRFQVFIDKLLPSCNLSQAAKTGVCVKNFEIALQLQNVRHEFISSSFKGRAFMNL